MLKVCELSFMATLGVDVVAFNAFDYRINWDLLRVEGFVHWKVKITITYVQIINFKLLFAYFFWRFRVLSVHEIMEPIHTNATMPLSANSNDVNPCPTPNGITVT